MAYTARVKVTLQQVDLGTTIECRRPSTAETQTNSDSLAQPLIYLIKMGFGAASGGTNARALMKYLKHLEQGDDVTSVNTAINAL
jgi:hypothetical protein